MGKKYYFLGGFAMKYIDKLKVGDSIGNFSPSSPITYLCPKRFERAKKYLHEKGFKIIEGNLTFLQVWKY